MKILRKLKDEFIIWSRVIRHGFLKRLTIS